MPQSHLLAAVPAVDRGKLQYEVAFNVVLAARRFRARFTERLKSRGQTDARWSALYMLAESPEGLIQSDLAERMGVQGPTLVRLLDALESQGLVKRMDVPNDRRVKRVVIQPDGLATIADVDSIAADLRNQVFHGLTDAELQTALFVVKQVTEALDPENPFLKRGELNRPRLDRPRLDRK